MGNKQHHNFGNLFVKTDKPFYYAGDTVTGVVYFNCTDTFPGNQIFLKIKGK